MKKREDYLIYSLTVVLIFTVFGLFNSLGIFQTQQETSGITGMATTATAETSASIANYFAITSSTNMSTDGIIFSISSLPATNVNASANYNVTNATEFYMIVGTDSNVNVDFCIKANDTLRSGANELALGNYTYSNSTANNFTNPQFDTRVLTTSFVNANRNIAAGSAQYFRLWLSVPASQAAGTYRNQINFKGVQTENSC